MVAIYDYGRTPEGVFYYAMEYLDGIDLQSLVERYGPQPVPRVIPILQQVCSSLYEAHSLGLVHRDIKPANIMLNRRGGEPDVVKVLDFGLVKALDEEKRAGGTQQSGLTGTPLYISPEAIQLPNSVDARSDLYAVSAVGYFLLTGLPVFDADNVMDLCQKHVATPPVPPSERIHASVPTELESALMACLEKSRAKRPQTARDSSLLLSRCPEATGWSIEDTDAWWGRHERGQASGIRAMPLPATSTAGDGRDLTIEFPRNGGRVNSSRFGRIADWCHKIGSSSTSACRITSALRFRSSISCSLSGNGNVESTPAPPTSRGNANVTSGTPATSAAGAQTVRTERWSCRIASTMRASALPMP
jgi:serine/threonine protein kinase